MFIRSPGLTGFTLAGIAAIVLIAAGCASGLSKEECQVADWRTIGYEDGVQGRSQNRISSHRKACAEHGIALELESYRSGWEEGVARFCQPGNGFQQGRRGKRYSGVCPQSLEAGFLQAYHEGRAQYETEVEIRRLTKQLEYHHKRLAQIEVEMRDAGLELVAKGIPTERRVVLLDDLRKLGDERSDIKAELPSIERQLENRRHDLAAMSQASAY